MELIPLNSTSSLIQPFWRKLFDPQSRFIRIWNSILFAIGILNLGNDSFFFIVPIIKRNRVDIDVRLTSILVSLRLVGDSCQLLGIFVKFRTSFDDLGNRVFIRRRALVRDPYVVAKTYLNSTFIIDFLAILPLPQVFLWCNLPSLQTLSTPDSQITLSLNVLKLILIFQFFPRLYYLFTLRKILIETGSIVGPAWSGAIYYLLLYIMLSQFIGAGFYNLYVSRMLYCRRILEKKGSAMVYGWDELLKGCAMDVEMHQGIFSDIYKNNIGSRSFLQRCMYCFSWGLKCLSSMGQNIETSASILETCFSFCMAIFGLVLFAGLIAQMQTSIQSLAAGEEQQMIRQKEVEEWANNHRLPSELKKYLQQTVESDWRALRDLDDESILSLLPSDLQCDIRRFLYLDLVCNIPFFANLDPDLVNTFCGYVRTTSFSKGKYIMVEGEPVKRILFISSGQLEISVVSCGSPISPLIGAGGLCGSELFAWCLLPSASYQNLPAASQSVKCLVNVEAFSLYAEDLKLLGIQYNYCIRFLQALRYPSH